MMERFSNRVQLEGEGLVESSDIRSRVFAELDKELRLTSYGIVELVIVLYVTHDGPRRLAWRLLHQSGWRSLRSHQRLAKIIKEYVPDLGIRSRALKETTSIWGAEAL
jgi:hypothetical protein